MSKIDDLRDPNSLVYKCSKISILVQRVNYKKKADYDFFVEKLCEENDITVKQFKDYEKEYWENINKVKQGVFNVQSDNFNV
tara:strand:- start:52 stop:297 length:246 start_codon:yes stop_codon:yes gene_type:complete